MRKPLALFFAGSALSFAAPSTSWAETYPEYLDRLRDICSVDCLQPRQFKVSARKRDADAEGDMALIMDVVEVRQVDDKFELHNMSVEGSALLERAILGSAGIDTSFGSGIGGLTTNRARGRSPNLVVIEMDKQTFADLLNTGALLAPEFEHDEDEDGIVVEGDTEREVLVPTLGRLRSYFRNRRVVVRGQPRLTPVWVGARLDRRRKQVTLQIDNPEDIALLPKYDDDGRAVIVDPLNRP